MRVTVPRDNAGASSRDDARDDARDISTDGENGLTEKLMQAAEKLTDRNATCPYSDQPTCENHALERLEPAEQIAYEVARMEAERGGHVSPGVVKALLAAIQRLEHRVAHAEWGMLECDGEPFPDLIRPCPHIAAQPAPPSVRREPDDGPMFVYRFFDRCGCLLYVGITNNFGVRRADHAKNSPWYKLAADFAVHEEPSRDKAETTEQIVIDVERPAFNRAGRSPKATAEQVTAYLMKHAGEPA
jgi:hypothetical protein